MDDHLYDNFVVIDKDNDDGPHFAYDDETNSSYGTIVGTIHADIMVHYSDYYNAIMRNVELMDNTYSTYIYLQDICMSAPIYKDSPFWYTHDITKIKQYGEDVSKKDDECSWKSIFRIINSCPILSNIPTITVLYVVLRKYTIRTIQITCIITEYLQIKKLNNLLHRYLEDIFNTHYYVKPDQQNPHIVKRIKKKRIKKKRVVKRFVRVVRRVV